MVLSLGAVGYREAVLLLSSDSAALLSQLDLLTALGALLASGALTFVAALIGIYGAWQRDLRALKIYAIFVFCSIGIQFSTGGFLLSVEAANVREKWEIETPDQRANFQKLLNCCGFDSWMDSMGKLSTACQLEPQPGSASAPPLSCRSALDQFLVDYVRRPATAAIVIACLEVFALVTTCVMVFKKKNVPDRYNAFDDDAL